MLSGAVAATPFCGAQKRQTREYKLVFQLQSRLLMRKMCPRQTTLPAVLTFANLTLLFQEQAATSAYNVSVDARSTTTAFKRFRKLDKLWILFKFGLAVGRAITNLLVGGVLR